MSAVYASPRTEERNILWSNLTKVADLHNKPRIMAGDFNEPLIEEDKFGGGGLVSIDLWLSKIVWIFVVWWIWGFPVQGSPGQIREISIISF